MSTDTDLAIIASINELRDRLRDVERRPVYVVTAGRVLFGGVNATIAESSLLLFDGTTIQVPRMNVGASFYTGPPLVQSPTVQISEQSDVTSRVPWLQFHARGYQEAFIRLATGDRTLEIGDNQSAGAALAIINAARTARVIVLTSASGGRVGIQQASPSYALHLGVDSAAKPGTNTWTVPSDRRTKDPQSVKPYREGLDKIAQLQPVVFKYNGDGGTPKDDQEYVGFVAQDVEAVAPGMIRRERRRLKRDDPDESEVLGVNTNDLQYMMVNAINELHKLVKAQADKIAALEAEVKKLSPGKPDIPGKT